MNEIHLLRGHSTGYAGGTFITIDNREIIVAELADPELQLADEKLPPYIRVHLAAKRQASD